jgi:hypothetical protein
MQMENAIKQKIFPPIDQLGISLDAKNSNLSPSDLQKFLAFFPKGEPKK